ncbi:DNA polymerase/3'-5' exonuclease PolX [soil metagenome]
MAYTNADITAIFEEVADLLEIEGANSFRVRAYRQAAENISDMGRSLHDLVTAEEDLTKLPGIGKDLAGAIRELVLTGTYLDLEPLRQRVNPSLRQILRIPGLGPKKVRKLHEDLGINTVEDLQAAVDQHRLSTLEGFGKKSEEKIAKELAAGRTKKERQRIDEVEETAVAYESLLIEVDGVENVAAAGSYRRKRDTIGDLDVLAAARDSGPGIEAFVGFDRVTQVTGQGETRSAVVLRGGLAVDLRVVAPESYGAALLYFTGSKDHNIQLRQRAIERGWKLNEYGLLREDDSIVAGASEEGIYRALDLPYIEPELRENRGEIESADAGTLPSLITLDDIKGDIHTHTTWSDGKGSIEEMARAALERGHEYVAITDHSPRLAMTNGLRPERIRQQMIEIREVQERVREIRILHGNEVDILKDGTLDQPDDILAELEIVIASVHSHFELSREAQTERVLAAINHPQVRIIGHLTGRLLTQRDGIDLDLEQVLTSARDAGVVMEINADPHRLDLDDRSAKFAKEIGCSFVINTDAHRTSGFDLMRHGVNQARRGWLEAGDAVNTLPLEKMLQSLRPKP